MFSTLPLEILTCERLYFTDNLKFYNDIESIYDCMTLQRILCTNGVETVNLILEFPINDEFHCQENI